MNKKKVLVMAAGVVFMLLAIKSLIFDPHVLL